MTAIFRFIHLIRLLPARIGGRLRWQSAPVCDVPLLCDGNGLVELAAKVGIGYRKAPMMGSGMIRLQARKTDAIIRVGTGTTLSNNVQIIAEKSIEIGCECLIGDGVLILDSDFHHLDPACRNAPDAPTAPVILHDRIWLGSRVIILKGVTIGEGSVVAAGSVVVRSVPPMAVVAGSPARIIRKL